MNYSYFSVYLRNVTIYCSPVGSPSHGEFSLMHGQISTRPKTARRFLCRLPEFPLCAIPSHSLSYSTLKILVTLASPNSDDCLLKSLKSPGHFVPITLTSHCGLETTFRSKLRQSQCSLLLFPFSQGSYSCATCSPISENHCFIHFALSSSCLK